jgi:Na+/H+ antiporter NhaC
MEGTFVSLAPPLVAILLCILLKEAILPLLLGVVVGSFLLHGFSPSVSFFRAFDEIILASFTDPDNAVILIFTVLTGGITGILNQSPATRQLLARLAQRIRSRSRAMLTIWFSGLLFFIDDYANCLVIGNAYRGLADRLRISREKLAYLVDTTSAPITSLALISTWIGFEVSLIDESLAAQSQSDYTGYGLFIASIPYRFYPILAIVFGFMIAWTCRDFGSMKKAEQAAIDTTDAQAGAHALSPDAEFRPSSWSVFVVVPLLVLIASSILLLAYQGMQSGIAVDWSHPLLTLMAMFGEADPFLCLLWATLISSVVSFVIHLWVLKEPFAAVHQAWFTGCKDMFTVCVILVLAWSIGDVCKQLKTGDYVASLLGEGFKPVFLPMLTFLFAGGISFATGTSYGTMSILMPIALPIALKLSNGNVDILYGTVGSVLGGAIFGDHCSPLSDTTILSSGASGCKVTAHVSTQLPYAITVGLVSLLCLAIMTWLPLSIFLFLGLGIVLLAGVLYAFGQTP